MGDQEDDVPLVQLPHEMMSQPHGMKAAADAGGEEGLASDEEKGTLSPQAIDTEPSVNSIGLGGI